MAVKTGVATQALGFVEEKLRRVFKLAGPIDASLNAELRPVIIVDDLRGPGHAFYQGRSWSICCSVLGPIAAGAKVAGVSFQDDCIVEGIDIRGPNAGANGFLFVFLTTPTEEATTPPTGGALSARTATWRDNKTVGTLLAANYDQPPLFGSLAFVANPGTTTGNGNIIWGNQQQAAGLPTPGILPIQLFMPKGSGLYVSENAFTDLSFTVWGRVFPQ